MKREQFEAALRALKDHEEKWDRYAMAAEPELTSVIGTRPSGEDGGSRAPEQPQDQRAEAGEGRVAGTLPEASRRPQGPQGGQGGGGHEAGQRL
eukprot:10806550-Alexandrium_andersonii.AAC.1